jgi:hypothetical protein
VSGIENKLAKIVGQAGLVGLETFLTSVLASMVDSNANRFGEFNSKSDCFNFGKGESLSQFGSMVISDGLASDLWSEPIEGSWGDGSGSGTSGLQSSALSSGLVEPDSYVSLPVLSQMHVGDHVVMLNHSPIN